MLTCAIVFFLIAVVAGVFVFTGSVVDAQVITQILGPVSRSARSLGSSISNHAIRLLTCPQTRAKASPFLRSFRPRPFFADVPCLRRDAFLDAKRKFCASGRPWSDHGRASPRFYLTP